MERLRERPIFGFGFGRGILQEDFREALGSPLYWHGHDVFLNQALGMGVIGLALFATALGLFTAIPLVFSHVLFKEWIARFEVKIKASSQKLITLVTNYKKDPKLLDKVLELDEDETDPKAVAQGARRG